MAFASNYLYDMFDNLYDFWCKDLWIRFLGVRLLSAFSNTQSRQFKAVRRRSILSFRRKFKVCMNYRPCCCFSKFRDRNPRFWGWEDQFYRSSLNSQRLQQRCSFQRCSLFPLKHDNCEHILYLVNIIRIKIQRIAKNTRGTKYISPSSMSTASLASVLFVAE